MKTKKKRKDLSKIRQELAQQIKVWETRILGLRSGWRAGTPGEAEKTTFCQAELERLRKELRKLSSKQRAWASHGYTGH